MAAHITPGSPLLGQILIEHEGLSPSALKTALEEQARDGGRLGVVLVRLGRVDAEAVARSLARQLGLDYVAPPLEPSPEVGGLLPESVARRTRAVPLDRRGRTLRLGMADPLDLSAAEDVRFLTGHRVDVVVVSDAALDRALDRLYEGDIDHLAARLTAPAGPADDGEALERAARAAPVVRLVDRLLEQAADLGASDLHVEPGPRSLSARLRIDGVLREMHRLPMHSGPTVISRLKIIAGMDISVRRLPQDGGMTLQHRHRSLALRLSTLPGTHGEKMVVRLLDPERAPAGLDRLGLAPPDLTRLRRLLAAGQGAVLAAGPTGSGKSSTLQAALREVDRTRLNVVALEDPVEARLPGVTHVQVDTRAGLTFPRTLRAVLRQDPDVIMVGEIRDRETAEIAMSAAVTGHLVLSSIHTTDAPGAVTRLLHMGVPPHLVAGGLAGVVAQRLVRTTCPVCLAGTGAACLRCTDGFAGRTGVFQVFVVEEGVREAIVQGTSVHALRRLARQGGMGTLADDVRRKIAERVTTPHEAGRILKGDPGAALPCERCRGPRPQGALACPWCGRIGASACICGERVEPGWRWCPWCVRKAPPGADDPVAD